MNESIPSQGGLVFQREAQIAEDAMKRSTEGPIDADAFAELAREYRALVHQAVKITRLGDSLQNKLIRVRNELGDAVETRDAITARHAELLATVALDVRQRLEAIESEEAAPQARISHYRDVLEFVIRVFETEAGDSGFIEPQVDETDLGQIALQAVLRNTGGADENEVQVHFEEPSATTPIRADETLLVRALQRVLEYLIQIARKHGRSIHVSLSPMDGATAAVAFDIDQPDCAKELEIAMEQPFEFVEGGTASGLNIALPGLYMAQVLCRAQGASLRVSTGATHARLAVCFQDAVAQPA